MTGITSIAGTALSKRSKLREGDVIALAESASGRNRKKYRICPVIGEGVSAVCYEAVRMSDGRVGKLKEFYPVSTGYESGVRPYSLRRARDGQLIAEGGGTELFERQREDYIGAYRLLDRTIAADPRGGILKNYIQSSEILYGISRGEGCASVYVWSAGPVGQGFDEYLAQVRGCPEKDGGKKLYNIISTLATLTDCIKALHTAGLMHLDIKPSNFLVPYDSSGNINPAGISLFDINTLYPVSGSFPASAGTEGFSAPELKSGRADNRSDIYSIGAMLFYGTVISADIPRGLYKNCHYRHIDRLVRHSALLEASEAGADVYLAARLANILKKCLAVSPRQRYDSCAELLRDLKKAEIRAKQYAVDAELIGGNKRLAIIDVNETGICDPSAAIQKMLSDRPLYEAVRKGSRRINVLTAGSGTYGQKFIDICLQTGQMKDISLSITALSETPDEDRENYLRFRPDVGRFVDVDGSMGRDKARAYASLSFAPYVSFRRGSSAEDITENRGIVSRIVSEAEEKGRGYDYIFVALGNDRINRSLAALFAEAAPDRPVCYVSGKTVRGSGKNGIYPVCINQRLTPEAIDPELERMAFNAHLCWNSTEGKGISGLLEEFRGNRYEYSSSLAYALSIKYKLHSIGISTDNAEEAAEAFLTAAEDKKLCGTLAALEHRRWVLSLVTDGWTAPRDGSGQLRLTDCVKECKVRNTAKRTHPCIVFSSEDTPLEGEGYSGSREKWDGDGIDPALDELDRMSVELHRCFKAQADIFRKSGPLNGGDIQALGRYVSAGGGETVRAFDSFLLCLKNILDGSESYSRRYGYYEGALKAALAGEDISLRREAEERLALAARAFFPVIEANLYRDYKANDAALLNNIPFILTNRVMSSAAAALNGRDGNVLDAAAAISALSPSRICFIFAVYSEKECTAAAEKLSALIRFMDKRNIRCRAEAFAVCLNKTGTETLRRLFDAVAAEAAGNRNTAAGNFEVCSASDSGEAAEILTEHIRKFSPELYDRSAPLFESESENDSFCAGINIPCFRYDREGNRFYGLKGCSRLSYLKNSESIRICDALALMNKSGETLSVPEFTENYLAAADIRFKAGQESWSRLCGTLRKLDDERPPLARIPCTACNAELSETVYIMPEYALGRIRDIITELIKLGAVGISSAAESLTSESCRVRIWTTPEAKPEFDRLFADPRVFIGYYGAAVQENNGAAEVTYNEMIVRNVPADGEMRALLSALEKAALIAFSADSKAEFRYTSPAAKRLLTEDREILRIYAFHKAAETGRFGDIAYVGDKLMLAAGFNVMTVSFSAGAARVDGPQPMYIRGKENLRNIGNILSAVGCADGHLAVGCADGHLAP